MRMPPNRLGRWCSRARRRTCNGCTGNITRASAGGAEWSSCMSTLPAALSALRACTSALLTAQRRPPRTTTRHARCCGRSGGDGAQRDEPLSRRRIASGRASHGARHPFTRRRSRRRFDGRPELWHAARFIWSGAVGAEATCGVARRVEEAERHKEGGISAGYSLPSASKSSSGSSGWTWDNRRNLLNKRDDEDGRKPDAPLNFPSDRIDRVLLKGGVHARSAALVNDRPLSSSSSSTPLFVSDHFGVEVQAIIR